MFASKRCKLVKRLWEESSKLVASYLSSPSQPPLWAAAGDYETFCSPEDRKAVECMLKRLRDSQLETMLQAVQTKGRDGTACLPLPHDDVKLPREVVAPHVLCCRLWRWPQLRHKYELKRLPWCAASPLQVCCNPYHWSIVHKPDSPPPPYSPLPLEDTYPPIGSSAEASTATMGCNGSPTDPDASADPWCIIAYWELNERVGPLYHVQRPWLHVTFDERAAPSGSAREEALSLHQLAADSGSACRDAAVLRTRAHIGQGVTLLHQRDGVWAYNRSEKALFVASPTLDGPSVRNLTVFKVPPGYSLRVFDWERARLYRSYPPATCEGPSYPYAARISFVKGWGPKYARQIVTSLPCSLELFFRAPPPR